MKLFTVKHEGNMMNNAILNRVKFFPVIIMFCRVRKQQEEDRLQRRVQEEAVKFLWKQVSMTMIT